MIEKINKVALNLFEIPRIIYSNSAVKGFLIQNIYFFAGCVSDLLTISQSMGQIMPISLLLASFFTPSPPTITRFSELPTSLSCSFSVFLVTDNWFKIQRHLQSCAVNVTSESESNNWDAETYRKKKENNNTYQHGSIAW